MPTKASARSPASPKKVTCKAVLNFGLATLLESSLPCWRSTRIPIGVTGRIVGYTEVITPPGRPTKEHRRPQD